VSEAAFRAARGDAGFLSPAFSKLNQSRNHQNRGYCFSAVVKSMNSGVRDAHHNINNIAPAEAGDIKHRMLT
jgi:hypothetical protein